MASLLNTSVVTELRTKTVENGLTKYINNPIGTDIRFVCNKRNSSGNNFEEDLIIGVNKITKSQVDKVKHTLRKRIEYRSIETTGDYYYLDITTQGGNANGGNVAISFRDGELQFDLVDSTYYDSPSDADITIEEDGLYIRKQGVYEITDGALRQLSADAEFYYNSLSDKIIINPLYKTEEQNLYYVDENGVESLVSTKTITEYFDAEDQHIILESVVIHQ